MTLPEYTPKSYLEALSIERFGGKTYGQEKVVSVLTTRTILLPNNSNRCYWQVINEGANDVRLTTDPAVGTATGWLLAAHGGVIISSFEDDGEVVGYQIYAIANALAANVRVREIIRI